jgi:hypothetical protein
MATSSRFPRRLQSILDQVHVRLGCLATVRGLLLEDVKHKDGLIEANGVDGPVRISPPILDDLEYSG